MKIKVLGLELKKLMVDKSTFRRAAENIMRNPLPYLAEEFKNGSYTCAYRLNVDDDHTFLLVMEYDKIQNSYKFF